MHIISKIGLSVCLIAFLIMIVLMPFLHIKVPKFVIYIFNGGLILTYAGAIIKARESKEL